MLFVRGEYTPRTGALPHGIPTSLTEIDVHCKLGYKDDALYLWGAFSENVPEALDLFEQRYEKLLGSYA
jgi:hypothetical protein